MGNNYIGVKELSENLGITTRRANQLCAGGMIEGAYKEGKFWRIPQNYYLSEQLHPYNTTCRKKEAEKADMRSCPVGITSYVKAVTECYYVDKTLLIRDIIDDHNMVTLFTRPRRFGKSLAIDMLRVFFEKAEEDTSVYFSDKEIWKQGADYQKYQGKYPVIAVSFKDAHHNRWEDTRRSLCASIRGEFQRHLELLSSEAVSVYDRNFMERILSEQADSLEYQFALGRLCDMLSSHFRSKVIILVDEYDTPIQQGYLHGYYDEVVEFMRTVLSVAYKDNRKLEFGVMTGILRIAKESLFSGLNNLVVNTVLDEKYSGYFGFTGREVAEMAAYYGKRSCLPEIREWYDGYRFGDREMYNPWSVTNYFNNTCVPKAFWSHTSGNQILGELLGHARGELQENLSLLMQGKEIEALIDTNIIYPEISGDPDLVYSFLLVSGYLKANSVVGEFLDYPIARLAIPNRELRSAFQKEIIDGCRKYFTGSILRSFEKSLRNRDGQLLKETLHKYLIQSASCFDTAYESFYHGMTFGMLAVMSDRYYISSNRESGDGRYDVQLEPMDKRMPGFILEFKADKDLSDDALEAQAEDALLQIRSKQYETEMLRRGVSEINLFGVAFSGKKVAVRME